MLMPRSIVGIDQYSCESYARLGFGHKNQSDEWRFGVLAILQVEKHWAKVKNSVIAYSPSIPHVFECMITHPFTGNAKL